MKVYLASWFASKDEMNDRAAGLRSEGIEVTSRWLEERVKPTVTIQEVADDYLRETAVVDVHDILIADTFVLRVPSAEELKTLDIPIASWARGGRHFETGFHYATMMFWAYLPEHIRARGPRSLIVVGHKENVFHYLDGVLAMRADGFSMPAIHQFDTWEEAKKFMVATHKERESVKAGN